MNARKCVMVDMSCTIIHHGHIRLLKQASKLGRVIVALTTDEEIFNKKGYLPELEFSQRKEILEAVKYVDKVVESKWLLDDDFIVENGIDILVHGDDNQNAITSCEIVIFPRTEGVSSSLLRSMSYEIHKSKLA